jgi:hypothetical protein
VEVDDRIGSLEDTHRVPSLSLMGQQGPDADTNNIVFVPGHRSLVSVDWVLLLAPMVKQELESLGFEFSVHFEQGESFGQLRKLYDI